MVSENGDGWQQIETAPKGDAANYVPLILWDEARESVTVGQWWHQGGRWLDYTDAEGDEPFHPTHWMPQPGPPPMRVDNAQCVEVVGEEAVTVHLSTGEVRSYPRSAFFKPDGTSYFDE